MMQQALKLPAKKTIEYFNNNKQKYKFNIIGLACVSINKKIMRKNSFYCAEFVRYVLNESNIQTNLPEIIKPENFKYLENTKCIYKGYLKKYNKQPLIDVLSLAELLHRKSVVE